MFAYADAAQICGKFLDTQYYLWETWRTIMDRCTVGQRHQVNIFLLNNSCMRKRFVNYIACIKYKK